MIDNASRCSSSCRGTPPSSDAMQWTDGFVDKMFESLRGLVFQTAKNRSVGRDPRILPRPSAMHVRISLLPRREDIRLQYCCLTDLFWFKQI